MKKTLIFFLLLLTLNSVGQKYFDLTKIAIAKTKAFKLKPKTIAFPVTYTTNEYCFVFEKSEITNFISDLRRFEKYKLFGFDSLKTAALTTKNDTVQFNKFASAFDNQLVLRFIDNLIMQKKLTVLINNKQASPKIKRVIVDQDMGGCIWTGYLTYINDKFFFDEVTAQGRKLN